MYTNPTVPNLPDYTVFAYAQGVPSVDLPSGALASVTINTAGALTATGVTGAVQVGMAIVGAGIPANTYLATWNGTSTGTVSPAPTTAVTAVPATTYSPYLAWSLDYAQGICLQWNCWVPAQLYVRAVYNLAFHQMLMMAEDVDGLALSTITWADGVATATATSALPFALGQPFNVTVIGANPFGFNGSFTALQTGSSSFQYELINNPGTIISPGTFGYGFFSNARDQFDLMSLTAGVVSGATDQGTSDTLVVPDFFKNLTMDDLSLLLTPWGRAYQGWAQAFGPNIVGYT